MRTVALLTILAVCCMYANAVVNNNLMLLVRPLLRKCAADNGVTDDQLKAIIANDLTDQSRSIQCTSLCFMNKLGMISMDGNLNVINTIASFSLGDNFVEVVDIVLKCNYPNGTDPCVTSSTIYACWVNNHLL